MTTLTDQILAVQRMARCSRYWARAARATAAEFEGDLEEVRQKVEAAPGGTLNDQLSADFVDVRTLTLDKDTESRRHDREATELEAVVRRLEEMNTVLSSFRIAAPDGNGDVWLHLGDQGDGKQGFFNLGRPDDNYQTCQVSIAHHVAALLETARQRALGDQS